MEVWKNIKNYEGLYKISNYGRVKCIRLYSHYRIINNKIINDYRYIKKYNNFRRSYILKTQYDTKGYENLTLNKNKIQNTFKIHRLVALTFIPNPDNKPQVNHIDGNKKNNHTSNLEWCTCKENINHAYKIGLISKTRKQRKAQENAVKLGKIL